jgi:integrase
MSTRYYQEGSLERVSRAKGPDVWVYRWRENRVQRKKVLGNVQRLKTKAEAEREVENFRAQINSELQKIGRMTLMQA